MKILYRKDSSGKIRIWKIYTQGFLLIQESGLKDGKLVLHSKVCTGKNIGKSNETIPEKQAVLELESEYKSKLDEGYFPTEEEAKNELVVLPMLAKSYDDYKHKIDWGKNVYVQPKLDGMRCLAHINKGIVKLVSRDGKEIQNMQHIIDELSKSKVNITLDGELYAHGSSFQENMKLIKKYRKGETEKIQYHVYDCVILQEPFLRRNEEVNYICKDLNNVDIVSTYAIANEKDLKTFHEGFINEGYEGSIIRWGKTGYKLNGRSENLLKYKDFQDIALPIIDITPNDANPLHGTPWFELKGKKFKAGCKLSHEDREDLLKNKNDYIGKTGEIRFFEYSDEGTPRFPVYLGVRLDK